MALKWWEQSNIVESQAARTVNKARATVDYLKEQQAERREAEAKVEVSRKEQLLQAMKSVVERRQFTEAKDFLAEHNMTLPDKDVMTMIRQGTNVKGWATDVYNQALTKARDKATKSLLEQEIITEDTPSNITELFIQISLLEYHAEEAKAKGDITKEQELRAKVDDYVNKIGEYQVAKAQEEVGPISWYGKQEFSWGGVMQVLSYPFAFARETWSKPGAASIKDIFTGQEYAHAYTYESVAEELGLLPTDWDEKLPGQKLYYWSTKEGSQIALSSEMVNRRAEIFDEHLRAYEEETPTLGKMGLEMVADWPLWILFAIGGAGLTATAIRAGTIPTGKAAGVVKGVLKPVEWMEKLPFVGLKKGASVIEKARLKTKWAKLDKVYKQDIEAIVAKYGAGETLSADDLAKIKGWDKKLGEVWMAEMPKVELAIPESVGKIQITDDMILTAQRNPKSPLAQPVFDNIFQAEPFSTRIRQLLPEGGLEARIAALSKKYPKIGSVVRLANPTLAPAEGIKANQAQEIIIVWMDRVYRRSLGMTNFSEGLLRSVTPDGDIRKLFMIGDDGMTLIPVKPQYKSGLNAATRTMSDVLENSFKYQLGDDALRYKAIQDQITEAMVRAFKKNGIHVNKLFFEKGGSWHPRMVIEAHGKKIAHPTAKPTKPRQYAEQLEALRNEIVYSLDPVDNVKSAVHYANVLIATEDLKVSIKALGKTARQLVSPGIVTARNKARAVSVSATKALRRLKWANKWGGDLPPATIKSIDRVMPGASARLKSVARLSTTAKKDAYSSLIKEMKPAVDKLRLKALQARTAYTRALEAVKPPLEGEVTAGSKHPLFKGTFFDEETSQVLNRFAGSPAASLWKATSDMAGMLRMTVAAADFSVMFIQGTLVLGRRPDIWAKTCLKALEMMGSRKAINRFTSNPKHARMLAEYPNIVQGSFEFFEALPTLRAIPVIGKPLAKLFTPFERYFTAWGNVSRVYMAEALEPAFLRAGKGHLLSTYVNRLTGVMETKALGIGATQRAIETSWIFFAPRYTRACMAYVGDIFKGGIVGHEARRSVAQLAAGGMTFYYMTCQALGQEPQLDPRYPTFMTVKIGDKNIGMGGFYYSFLRFGANVTASVLELGGAERQDIFSLSRRDGALMKFLYNRTSILTGLVFEGVVPPIMGQQPRDYLGYPLEDVGDWAHWLFVEHMMPIALQTQFPGKYEDPPSNRLSVLAAEELGLRVFPDDPFYKLRDQYAMQIYGVKWADLYNISKDGTYRESKRQDWLIEHFPDLKEAYSNYKEKKDIRWKTEHGLL